MTVSIVPEGGILGLKLKIDQEKRTFYFRVDSVEKPIVLAPYSLGAASPMNTAGTAWNEIIDANSRYHLEPEFENVIYRAIFGIDPGETWVYLRYPPNVDVHSLIGTRAIGSGIGHISGSPFLNPSDLSEFFTLKDQHPSFLGYHPYATPSSITVRLSFFVVRYDVKVIGVDPSGAEETDKKRLIAPQGSREKAVVRTMMSHLLVDAPNWLLSAIKK